MPLNKRVKTVEEPVQRKKAKKAMADAKAKVQKSKKRQKPEKPDEAKSRPKRQKSETANDKKVEKKWDTLHHCGVLFPPDYKPHGVKMLYDGRQVDLTPEQEEVSLIIVLLRNIRKSQSLDALSSGISESETDLVVTKRKLM